MTFSYISAADGSYLQTAKYVQETQSYMQQAAASHSVPHGASTDNDSYIRTDEEDAELYDHDPKVSQVVRKTFHISKYYCNLI